MAMHVPLTEKYRPKTLDEIMGNEEVIECIKTFSRNNLPHMLFYGPPGTGKTTAIRALTSSLPKQNVLELNASDERGINTVRETIKEFASIKSSTIKVIILDEADSMTRDSQDALRRIIEDYKNTRFCFICNYYKKIIDPIVSRCTKFRFFPVNKINRIKEVCIRENISFEEDGLEVIDFYSDGDMRKMMNDIEGISKSYDRLTKTNVLEFFGMSDEESYKKVFEYLKTASFDECLGLIKYHEFDCSGLVDSLTNLLIKSELPKRYAIMKQLADIEINLSAGCSDLVQMNGIISAFILNR